jgi:hypothetical protein
VIRRAATLTLALLSIAAPAYADETRVAIVGDPALVRAVEVTLEPWGVVVVADADTVGATMPGAAENAAIVAARDHANAVAWISDTNGDTALWVYDASEHKVASRPLRKKPPFDDATAASIALSIKTLLRLTSVAPPAERFGARRSGPNGELESPGDVPPTPAPSATEPSHPLVVEFTTSARFAQTDAALAEPRAMLGIFWAIRDLSIGAEFSIGPGVGVSTPQFDARIGDFTIAAHARYAFKAGALRVVPEIGPSGHVEFVDGAFEGAPVHTLRLDPALDAGVLVAYAFSERAYLGVHGGASWLLRFQRFTVDGVQALGGSPVIADVGLRLGVALP